MQLKPVKWAVLTDALHRGTLSPAQAEIVRSLREGLSLVAEREIVMVDVKVPS